MDFLVPVHRTIDTTHTPTWRHISPTLHLRTARVPHRTLLRC
jgi:hypothetical protein